MGYPFICEFIDVGDEIDTVDFANADPQLALALVAMRYAFEPSERERFLAALKAFKALGREGALDFLKEVYVYLRKVIPVKDKELFMDTEDVLRNKGYKSISDADIELGEQKARLEDAEAFLRYGDSVEKVSTVLKLPLKTVQAIADRIAKES